ncbi:MAG: hypothetical protein K0R44_1876 [Thermomicrobiales bacterium]|nr:hypothetical protein [Thermomicrobiales bacterium]
MAKVSGLPMRAPATGMRTQRWIEAAEQQVLSTGRHPAMAARER